MEVVAHGGTHILKPEPNEFPELPQNENLCMSLAWQLKLNVPPQGLFSMEDKSICYLVKRFDRLENREKIHMENAAQILGLEDKYRGSLEQVGKVILKYASHRGLDVIDFFERVLFCYLVGNGDMHLKNWSLLIVGPNEVSLAPCYDLVSSKIYLPNEEETALTLNGKRSKIKKMDFESFASYLEIDRKALENIFLKFETAKEKILETVGRSLLSDKRKGHLKQLILDRYRQID